ncbi:hypothetical protein [Erwinia sp. CGal63]|uniref:hypothetical protein n=1 Tax=Erwinia sp. CGal63 TaxID=2919889 RepID=UPI003008D12F
MKIRIEGVESGAGIFLIRYTINAVNPMICETAGQRNKAPGAKHIARQNDQRIVAIGADFMTHHQKICSA